MDEVGDIVIGNVLQPGGGQAMARMAMLEAGMTYNVPVASINRQCSSGLQAVATVVSHVKSGDYEIGVAGGVESMSSCSFEGARPIIDIGAAKASPHAAACLVPMGITSENIAERYQIGRVEQDRYSLKSHLKAAAARGKGAFKSEIIAINGVTEDEGIRPDTSIEVLASLKPAFKKQGTTTAGNSSQLSDGAAAVVGRLYSHVIRLNYISLTNMRFYSVLTLLCVVCSDNWCRFEEVQFTSSGHLEGIQRCRGTARGYGHWSGFCYSCSCKKSGFKIGKYRCIRNQ